MTKQAQDLRDIGDEIDDKLRDAQEELFNLRFQLATGQLDNFKQMGAVRRQIARMRTIKRERELGMQTEPNMGEESSSLG